MKNVTKSTVSAGLLMAMALVFQPAQADEALAQKSGCMACHAVDKKVVGPSFKDVAAKYKGDDGAVEMLSDKVKNGGSGVWGQMPMPPSTAVSDEDIATLVKWILSL